MWFQPLAEVFESHPIYALDINKTEKERDCLAIIREKNREAQIGRIIPINGSISFLQHTKPTGESVMFGRLIQS